MTTVLTSYSLLPELQHFFHHFVINSEVNKSLVPAPVDIAELFLPKDSFVGLLLNDNYSEPSYEYRYLDETNVGCVPRTVVSRLQVYPTSWRYLVLDPTGENIFNLQPHDFTLLDALLSFRNGATDETRWTFTDSTSISFIADSTANTFVLSASYDSLSTELSKLVYLYLRLELLEEFSIYNNINELVSSGGLIVSCFEAYLIEKYFTFMTKRQPDLIYDCICDEGDNT
jgi:hypothetical protein